MPRPVQILGLLILAVSFCFAETPPQAERIYDFDGDKIFENLQLRAARAKHGEKIPAIIVFKNQHNALAASSRLSGMRIYDNIPAGAALLSADQVKQLASDPSVEHIELDATVHACMESARASFGVQKLRSQFGFNGDRDGVPSRYSTQDIVIAVIDSGVQSAHPDFQGKILYWKDYVNGRSIPYDDAGHGTHVAGVAAGAGKGNSRYAGVAPGAALVVLKVLDANGNGNVSDALAAIDEVISRRLQYNIRILNLSLAVSGSSSGRDALSLACNRAVANGISVIVAAGNEGPNPRTIGSPSAAASVVTVGAGADLGEKGFYIANYSSRGPTADGRVKPDLWAPGIRLRSPRPAGGYSDLSGTSLATPFVSGVVALMLDAQPALSPGAVKRLLLTTAIRWAPGGKNNETGVGRLQAYQAVTHAAAIVRNLQPPAVPDLLFRRNLIQTGQTHSFPITVASARFPIAVSVIIQNFLGADLDVELVSPSGTLLRRAATIDRQETITYLPTVAGIYTVNVRAITGETSYTLNISTDLAN